MCKESEPQGVRLNHRVYLGKYRVHRFLKYRIDGSIPLLKIGPVTLLTIIQKSSFEMSRPDTRVGLRFHAPNEYIHFVLRYK